MATRAQMIADINASRPDPYAHLTEEQLLALLNHTDPKLRDAARQILASRQPKESTTADLANETRPIPEVAPVDEGWKGGKFDWSAANREVATAQADAGRREDARQARLARREDARQARLGSPADLDPVESAATQVLPDPQVGADMSSTDVLPGPQPGTVRKWNPTTKRYDVVAVSKPAPDEPAPFYGRSVPGRAKSDGSRGTPTTLFASQEEADAYNLRPRVGPGEEPIRTLPEDRPLVNTETGLMSSQRDMDMMRRGFVPVYDASGEVTYMRSANPVGEQNVASMPGANYTTGDREGPLGKQAVLVPTGEARERLAAVQQARRERRDQRDAERQKMVVMQAQATQRPMNFLNNPDADPWAKRVMSEALLRSGHPGATPIDMEAQQMKNTQRVREQEAVGALNNSNDPVHAQLAASEANRQRDQEATWRKEAWNYGENGANGWNPFESSDVESRRDRARNRVKELGGSAQDADRIANELYPPARGDGRVDGRGVTPPRQPSF
jgi:hypothetical protein